MPNHTLSRTPPLFHHQDVFSRNVLTFLSARDLCRFSVCSKFCHRISLQGHLWSHLQAVDFSPDAESLLGHDVSYLQHEVFDGTRPVERNRYKCLYEVVCDRIKRAHDTRQQILSDEASERKLGMLEKCLDCSQYRFMIILPGIVIICTLFLFGIKFDGAAFSAWYCFVPLFFLMLYIAISSLLSGYLHGIQPNLQSSLRLLWRRMQSPIKNIYENALRGKLMARVFVATVYLMAAVQLVFVGIKLTGDVAIMDNTTFDWGIVFLPLWILFTMYLCGPCVWRQANGLYFLVLILIWLPFLIFFICLAIKLNNSGKDDSKLALELILIPFWIIEGAFLLGALIYAMAQYYRYAYHQIMCNFISKCISFYLLH